MEACALILAYDVTDKLISISRRFANGTVETREMEYRKAAEILLPTIQEMIEDEPLTALGVVRGPGSFTGIRVGLSTALGIKASLGIPVLGFSKFELAARVIGDGHYRVVIPSVRNQLLTAIYRGGRQKGDPCVYELPALAKDLPIHVLGTLPELEANPLTFSFTEKCLDLLHEPEAHHPLEPLYIRPPDAKKSRALLDRLLNPE